MTILQVDSVDLSFGQTQILHGLSLDVREGERHAVIGPNGAGKSTLFNVISGFYRPNRGSVKLRGEEIGGERSHLIARRGLSRSFQISAIFGQLSVFENVRLSIMPRKRMWWSFNRIADRITPLNRATREMLELVGLDRVADKPAGDLTYSEQRALEVAMTLGPEPSVILLDEPTAGMSGDESSRFVEMLRRLTVGKTLLVVEHDMDVVFSLCDRISVLVTGQVIASGSAEDIRGSRKVQEAYLGTEA